jgi:hypothetical protein
MGYPAMEREKLGLAPIHTRVEINIIKRRTPVRVLKEALIQFQSSDVDFVERRDTIILRPVDGEIMATEDGRIIAWFRYKPLREVLEWIKRVLRSICSKFWWDPASEPLDVGVELIFTCPNSSRRAQDILNSSIKEGLFEKLIEKLRVNGIHSELHGVGIRLFLTPLKDGSNRIIVQIEPAFSEPDRSFFVDLIVSRSNIVLERSERYANVERVFDEIETLYSTISNFLRDLR